MQDFKLIITQIGEDTTSEMFINKGKGNEWYPYEMLDRKDLMLLRRLTAKAMNSEMRKHREKKLKEG